MAGIKFTEEECQQNDIFLEAQAALRMQCLDLALRSKGNSETFDVIEQAQKMFDFVTGKNKVASKSHEEKSEVTQEEEDNMRWALENP